MQRGKNDILQGTLTLLVLRALDARGPMHGYALCGYIQSVSDDLLRVEEGSLYPALHRMEQEGWVSSEWQLTGKGRRAKVYALTDRGRTQFAAEKESWLRLSRGVTRALRYS
mgnify:CR=1 FL=1